MMLKIAYGGCLNWSKMVACMGYKGVNFNVGSMFIFGSYMHVK